MELEIDNDKLVKISENTRLGVSELAGSVSAGDDQTGLKLWFGNVWTNIKSKLNVRSKYEIRTPKTVMGVRGTRFYVGMENQNTVVAVLEGRVLAVTYSSEQRPDGTVLEQAVQSYIEQNQQTSIAEGSGGEAVISVAPVSLRDIDAAVLVEILQTPQGISEEILNETAKVIQERINEISPNTIVDLLRNTQNLPPVLQQDANNSLQQRIDEIDPNTLQDILNNPQGINQETLQQVQTESQERPPVDDSSDDEEVPDGSSIIPVPSSTPDTNTDSSSGSGSGGSSGGNTTVAVTSVSLNETSISLEVGGEFQLNATVYPADATNKNVTWESYNTNVATVSDNGLVEAIGPGTTEIEVATVDSGKTATCAVTVTQGSQIVSVESVSLNEDSINLHVGNTVQLTETVNPADATNKDVTWESDNTGAATVDNGLVTAVGEGTANITVTTVDGGKTATCAVTVTQDSQIVSVESVSLNETSISLFVGDDVQLTETVNPPEATNKNVTWESDNTGVATVNNGLVTAVGEGTANITVTTVDGGYSASCVVTVSLQAISDAPNPEHITVVNNGGANDYVVINSVPENTEFNIYLNEFDSVPACSVESDSLSEVYSTLLSLSPSEGTLYASLKEPGKSESTRVPIPYDAEMSFLSYAPSQNDIIAIDDFWYRYVKVEYLNPGDIVKVYDKRLSGRTLLEYKIVPFDAVSGYEYIRIDDWEATESTGYVYVSVVRCGGNESIPVKCPIDINTDIDYINIDSTYGMGTDITVGSRNGDEFLKVYADENGTELLEVGAEAANNCNATLVFLDYDTITSYPEVYISMNSSDVEGLLKRIVIPPPPIQNININAGTIPGSTKINAVLSTGTKFIVRASTAISADVSWMCEAPAGLEYDPVVDVAGINIEGVDPTYKSYVEIYEVNENNEVVAFECRKLQFESVNGMAIGISAYPMINPGSVVGSIVMDYDFSEDSLYIKNGGLTPIVTPALDEDISVTDAVYYEAGIDIGDLSPGDYLGLYRVASDGKIKEFNIYEVWEGAIKPAPPQISRLAALEGDVEGEPFEEGFGLGDKLEIHFDVPTNMANVSAQLYKEEVDSIIDWNGKCFGTNYSGIWSNWGQTLTITCTDAGEADFTYTDTISIKVGAGIRDYYDISDASTSNSENAVVVGNFDSPDRFLYSSFVILIGGEIVLANDVPSGIQIWIAPKGLESKADFDVLDSSCYTYISSGNTMYAPEAEGEYSLYLIYGNLEDGEFIEGSYKITVTTALP